MGVKKAQLATAAAIVIQDEGGPVEAAMALMNFTGGLVTASQTAPGQVQVDIPIPAPVPPSPGTERSIIGPLVIPAMSPYTAVYGETVIVDPTTGPIIVKLPAATVADDGKFVEVKSVTPIINPVQVWPAGGGLVDFAQPYFNFPSGAGTEFYGVKLRVVCTAGGGSPNWWAAVLHFHYLGAI